MKFKELTQENIDFIRKTYFDTSISWDNRLQILSEYTEKSKRCIQDWVKNLGFTTRTEIESVQYDEAKKKQFDKTKSRFIITWAQNDTPVHSGFLQNIEAYAKFIDADIHIIAGRYRNPTTLKGDDRADTWSPEIQKYLDANRHNIHKYVSILSDVKIQPTAVNPMSGMEGISGINSCIFGSPKVHLDVIPVLEGSTPKIMMTTGAITKMNYTDSKAGKKGEFHHTLGFVIIEIENGEIFHARQVTANDETGNFNDLFYNVEYGIISRITEVDAIVLGDIHLGDTDEVVMESTIDLLDKINPKFTVVHDIFNGHSISHHDLKNPVKLYLKEVAGTNVLKKEIEEMLDWIEKMRKYNLVIVRSNHDDFVDRWILNTDWKSNIKNSLEYMEYAKVLLEDKAPKGIIPYIIDKHFPDVKTLGRDQSFIVKKWELGVHGDMGQNGSKGSLLQFRRLNTKIIVAHYHSPERKDGALSVGTSTRLRLDYNIGPSNWLNSHVIIHTDGKCQHINFIKGKFTTLE